MKDVEGLSRRDVLGSGLAGAALLGLGALGAATKATATPAPSWLSLLAQSESGARDYHPLIEGVVPATLNGSLYRNRPGLFERNGVRKRNLLDGDGLVQRLSFAHGQVRYQNNFVQTAKFIEEEAAQRYLYSTWSTRRPGGPLRNLLGGRMQVQAGVTVYPVGGELYAFDEGNPIYELHPETLETIGTRTMGTDMQGLKAHTKFDPVNGDWLLAGQGFGRQGSLQSLIYDRHDQLKYQHTFANTPMVYIHDFMVTEHYFVYVLHPCELRPLGFLLGFRSVIDSLRWNTEQGNRIVVVPRAGGKPRYFEAEGAFMWHTLNAYEQGKHLIADIVTYDHPDQFIGEQEPLLSALPAGRTGTAHEPGKVHCKPE